MSRRSRAGGRASRSGSRRAPSTAYMICRSSGSPATARSSQSRHSRRLVGVAGPDQRLEGERGVAQPAVAVVPVALAAEVLGQRRRGRGDDAAGLLVGEQPQRQQRAVHDVGVRDVRAGARRSRPPRPGRVASIRSSMSTSSGSSTYDGSQVVAKVSSSPSRDVELVDVAAVGGRREPGTAQHQLVGAGDRGDHLLAVDRPAAHPRPDLAVVDADDPLVPHPHRPAHAGDPADQVGPAVAGRHQVDQRDLAGVGPERRLEHRGVVEVAPGRRRTRRPGRAASGRGPRCRAAPRSRRGSRTAAGTASRPSRRCPTRAAVCRSPISA